MTNFSSQWVLEWKHDCQLGNAESYSLKAILEGRSNPAYTVVYQRFLPCVVGKLLWHGRLRTATNDNELSTVSDEAFVLLCLENSWERWEDIYKTKGADVFRRRGSDRRDFISTVPTKYTAGGVIYPDKKKRSSPRGWNEQGIQRYNSLHKQVKADRVQVPFYGKKWIEYMTQDINKKQ